MQAASDVLVSDKAGALEFIQKSHGCMLRDLRQVYANAEKDVEALKKDGLIWILPSSEKDQKIVYPREKPPMISVNESIGKAWLSIQVFLMLSHIHKCESCEVYVRNAFCFGCLMRPNP